MNKSKLPQRCRACLEPSKKMYPLNGTVVNVEVDISAMISYCISSELELREDLPDSVCLSCFKIIRIAYNFFRQFKESQEKLMKEQKVAQHEMDFDEMVTYTVSEDGMKLTEVKVEALADSVDQDYSHVDTYDNSLYKTESTFAEYDLHMIHNYAERSNTHYAHKNFEEEEINAFIPETKHNIDHKTEGNTDTQIKDVTGSDSLTQYLEDSDKLNNDIRAILTDSTDPASLDKFIIVNETDDEEVKIESNVELKAEIIDEVETENDSVVVEPSRQTDETTSRCIYVCPVCNSQFNRLPKFNDHILLHNRTVIVCNKCPCPVELSTLQYIQHYKQHHRYQCRLCDKSLTSSYGYRYHMTQHENIKKYKCPVKSCSKSFILFHILKKHMRTHSETIKYTCNLCKATFRTYDTYRYHQKTHDGKRNHLCTLCGKAFFQAVHLRDHMFRHLGFKRFTCESCGYSFTTNSQLKKHFKHCSKRDGVVKPNK